MTANKPQLTLITNNNDTLLIQATGEWTLRHGPVDDKSLYAYLNKHSNTQHIQFDFDQLKVWDSYLLLVLQRLEAYAKTRNIEVHWQRLPTEMQHLLQLADQPSEPAIPSKHIRLPWLIAMGDYALDFFYYAYTILRFIGDLALSFVRWITGRATFSYATLARTFYETGPKILPAITLIGLLLGAVLAFGGIKPLQLFKQDILVAQVIGYGVVRQAAPIFTALFILLRSGAGITGEISHMQEQQQIDALRVNVISAMDFIVLPRVVALVLLAPLLCLYLGLVAILGGMFTSVWYFELNLIQFYDQLHKALDPSDMYASMIKATLLSYLVAVICCQRGMYYRELKRSVTQSIASTLIVSLISILIANAILEYVLTQLGI